MTEIWVDEDGNEYTADQLDFETPKKKEQEQSEVASTKDYIRATTGLVEDFLPLGDYIVGAPAAYIASKITGEPYETVREGMKARGKEARQAVKKDIPTISNAYDIAVPISGTMASLVAGTGAVSSALPKVASVASKIPGSTKMASGITKGTKWLADKPVIRTALSTDPLKSSAAMSSLVGTGTAAIDLAKGESLAKATKDAVSNASDTFAYMYGGRVLPYKAVPLAMAGYEAITNPIDRLARSEKPLSKEGFIGDVITGVAGGALARTARPADTSTVKGSKLAKQADLYKEVTDQSAGDIDVKALQEYSGQKNLRDIPLEANVATQASLKSTLPKEIRKTGVHHGKKADEIGKALKTELKKYSKGATTEEIRAKRIRGEQGIAAAEGRLLEQQPLVTTDKVKKAFRGKDDELSAFLNKYAQVSSEDTGIFAIPNIDDMPSLNANYVLETRRRLSQESTQKGRPLARKLANDIYDVFDDKATVKQLKESNRLYSEAESLKSASSEAIKEGRLLSETGVLKEVSQEAGGNRQLVSKLLRNIEDGVNTGSVSNGVFTPKTLPDNIQNLLKAYDYHRTMEQIANQELVRKGTQTAISELGQRAIAAPALGSNFAAYTGVKETVGWFGKHLPRQADRKVLGFISNVPADKAIEALKAKPGSIISDSMLADMLKETVSKLPKKGGK